MLDDIKKRIDIITLAKQLGLQFHGQGTSLKAKCFNTEEHRHGDRQFSLSFKDNLFKCFGCGVGGSVIDLYMGVKQCDFKQAVADLSEMAGVSQPHLSRKPLDPALIEKSNAGLKNDSEALDYLHGRGFSDEIIAKFKLGVGKIYGTRWVTIPIYNHLGIPVSFKLRLLPGQDQSKSKMAAYPAGAGSHLFGYHGIPEGQDDILITEGEFDSISARAQGFRAVCGTAGASTFMSGWVEMLEKLQPKKIIVIYDNDDAGVRGREKVIETFALNGCDIPILNGYLPAQYKDINDFHKAGLELKTVIEKAVAVDVPAQANYKELLSKQTTMAKGMFQLAKHMIDTYHIKTIGEQRREPFVYQSGVYMQGLAFLKKIMQEMLEEIGKQGKINEIIEQIQNLTHTKRELFNVEPDYINLANGFLHIPTNEFSPHDPDNLFMTKLPVEYNPEAVCPETLKVIQRALPEENDQNLLQEVFGFCLYRQYFIKKAVIFVGPPDTGKTTTLRILVNMIGPDNITDISLQKIASDKFASADLYQKQVNMVDDLQFRDVNDNGTFKMAVGGGWMGGENKFGNRFQFKNFAKFIFACNKIPIVKDQSDDAYFDRWVVMRFENPIEKEQINYNLDRKLSSKEEISGVFNWALAGLNRILKKGQFNYNKKIHEIKAEMTNSGSSIASFINEKIIQKDESNISKSAMYQAYVKYCHEKGFAAETEDKLGKNFKRYAWFATDSTTYDENKSRVRSWYNTAIKDDDYNEPVDNIDEIAEQYRVDFNS